MKQQMTVKKRIFISSILMILVTLVIIAIINVGVVTVYWESMVEKGWKASMETMANTEDVKFMVKQWTVHRQSFYVMLLIDVLVCAGVWILVSQIFTRRLVRQIMEPLDLLGHGAKRIRENKLTEEINYHGDMEFEEICQTFNAMQAHILAEQEKNRKYEKARTEMIAGISHDLRTPLTAIRGSIKAILDGIVKAEPQKEKFLQAAYRRTGEMDTLLNQLFYVSKLETGNMPLHLQETDLHIWLSNYLEEKRKLFASDEIIFSEELVSVSGTASIDPEQFQRIFDNLLENSRKYAQADPLLIHVTLQENDKEFLIRFSDNGHGVPDEKLEHIFDEFYRVDESRNKKEGNGLGLYIVKSLITSMGGTVQAKSSPGLEIEIILPKAEKVSEKQI